MSPGRVPMPALTAESRRPSLCVRSFGEAHVTLTLQRADVHNALDAPLVDALTETLQALDERVRTVLIEGEGPSFCAGADLRGWQANLAQPALRAEALATLFETLRRMRPVAIAKVHGIAAGGGVGLAAACDIVVAARDARFRFPEVRLGLVPAVISSYVERAMGTGRARYLFLTAATLPAVDAHAAGLVHRLAEPDDLQASCEEVLRALWRGGPQALSCSKWLLDDLAGRSASERAQVCQQMLDKVRAGAEAQEGIRAFLAGEPPAWSAL